MIFAASFSVWIRVLTVFDRQSLEFGFQAIRMSFVRLTWLLVLFILSSEKVSYHSPFSIIKGALDGNGPVLTRNYGEEAVNV